MTEKRQQLFKTSLPHHGHWTMPTDLAFIKSSQFRWKSSRPGTRRLRARSIPASAKETEITDINDDISIAEESIRAADITEDEKALPECPPDQQAQSQELGPSITDSSWITDSASITDSIDITDNCQITDTPFITDTT